MQGPAHVCTTTLKEEGWQDEMHPSIPVSRYTQKKLFPQWTVHSSSAAEQRENRSAVSPTSLGTGVGSLWPSVPVRWVIHALYSACFASAAGESGPRGGELSGEWGRRPCLRGGVGGERAGSMSFGGPAA